MILLSGHSLTADRSIPDETLGLQLKERESTASWTPEDMSGIGVNSWVRIKDGPGDGTVWRVRSIERDYAENTPAVELEHIVSTLKDALMFGEITPAAITGNPEATTCTAKQAVEYILARSADWTLGAFDYAAVSNPYKFDGDSLYDALEKVTDSLDGAWWSYDLSSYPFKLNITQKPAGVACELRAGRNLVSLVRTVDRSGMYTRFYPIGKDDLHIPGNYVGRNEELYGTVSRVEVDASRTTVAELTAWANERLSKHAEPSVNITADGLELADATGESLDRLTLGRICRMPLPEFNTTIEERIVELSYPDALNEPERVRITMANSFEDVSRIIAENIRRNGAGGRAGVREQGELYNEMYSEDGLVHSIIQQTATMIRMEVGDAVSGIYGSVIEQTATYIRTEVRDAASRIAQSVIEQTADYVHTEVSDIASGVAWSVIHQTMTGIMTEVGRKATVYVQWSDPNDGTNVLREGDIWIKTAKRTWGELANIDWNTAKNNKWRDFYGSLQYVWRNGKWVQCFDEAAVVESNTWIEHESDRYAIMSRQLDTMGESYHSNLTVTAQRISADVSTAKSQIYSSISQTATNINLHVEDKIRGVQSNIEQTADRITASVSAAKSMLWSQIEQTATGIMLQVNDDIADLHSAIVQTSTNIHMSVSTAKSALYSAINISATGIMQEVVDRDSDLQSAINQTSTNIHISVSTAKSTLYSAINVTATGIMQDVVDKENSLRSAIKQTSTNIHLSVSAAKSTLYSAINITATGIMQDVVDRDDDLRSAIVQTSTNIHISVSAAKSSLYGAINVTSTGIMQEVVNKESNLRSAIVASSTQISLRVEKGNVISSINQSAEEITISASKINLDGYVKASDITASYISAKIADITLVEVKGLNSYGTIRSTGGSVVGADIAFGSGSGSGFSSWSLKNFIKELQIASSGNTYTLQKKSYNDESWVNVGSFSRAVTSFGLSWSGGGCTITAQPQGNTHWFGLAQGTASWNGRTVSIPINWSDGGQYSSSTGYTVSATYTLPKSDISMDRGGVQYTQPSADGYLTEITSNGWCKLTITAAGTTKSYAVRINVQ